MSSRVCAYQSLHVRLEQEALWLNLNQLSELFERDYSVISRHLRNVFATTASEGKTYQVEHFNLDAIISVE